MRLRLWPRARQHWFAPPHPDDSSTLAAWRDVAVADGPPVGVPPPLGWTHDTYSTMLSAFDPDGAAFARVRRALLAYAFFPPTVMLVSADFTRAHRLMRPGDRVVQRVPVVGGLGRRVLDVLLMNEIALVDDTPTRAGFVAVSTAQHSEQGWWSAHVAREDDGAVVLTVRSVARLAPREPLWLRPYMRWRQVRAHQAGIARMALLARHTPPRVGASTPSQADDRLGDFEL